MEWIKCSERMPKEDELVICYGREFMRDAPTVTVGSWNKYGWSSRDWDGCGGYDTLAEITHWQELPEPPKE